MKATKVYIFIKPEIKWTKKKESKENELEEDSTFKRLTSSFYLPADLWHTGIEIYEFDMCLEGFGGWIWEGFSQAVWTS